jgi:hypothetical protein
MFTEFFAIIGLCATIAADILGGNVDRNVYPNTAIIKSINSEMDEEKRCRVKKHLSKFDWKHLSQRFEAIIK